MLSELPPQTAPQWFPPYAKAVPTEATAADMTENETVSPKQKKLRPSHLLILPVPCLSASTDFRQRLMQDLVLPYSEIESGEAHIMVLSEASPASARRQMLPHAIPYRIEGISLLVKAAAVRVTTTILFGQRLRSSPQYESGPSPLAAWVPRSQLPRIAQLALST